MNLGNKAAIGIDLGTTYSTISYVDEQGQAVCVENSRGDILTPSAVCIDSNTIVIGKDAVKASAFAPDSYFECFKREMGGNRKFVFEGMEVPAEVLSGLILDQLKSDVEERIGVFQNAVITVPAYFDENRRQSTVIAAELAGIDVLKIINEPTAAAVAYGINIEADMPQVVLVYDLGGGTFDASILRIERGDFVTLATDGDVRLGGKDFDERLANYLAEEFKNEHGIDPRQNSADLAQLFLDAEEIKQSLTERQKVPHVMYFNGLRHRVEITRQKFDELTADLVSRSQMTVEMLLRDANMGWDEIDELLLVGGATRIPAVQAMLSRISGKRLNRSMNPDQVVSQGAALLCHSLINKRSSKKELNLFNVNSHSLGVIGLDPKTRKKRNSVVIPRNTALPFCATKTLVTGKLDQRSVSIPVVEGESHRPEECVYLGKCSVRDLPMGLPAGTKVKVHFSYDSAGRLAVSARIPKTRQSATTVIERNSTKDLGRLDDWKKKLTGANGAEESGQMTRSGMIRRLDRLFQNIGRTAASDPLHESTVAQRLANLRADMKQKETRFANLQAEQSNASSRAEAIEFSRELAKLSDEITSLNTEIEFTEIEVGKQAVTSNDNIRDSPELREAQRLIAELTS